MPLHQVLRRARVCSSLFLATAFTAVVVAPACANAKMIWDFKGKLDGIFAEHTDAPMDPASERLFLEGREKVKFNKRWSAIGTVQGWYEGLYTSDTSYPETLRKADLYEVRAQETYLQYMSTHWIVKAGNQIDVWGETFGNFYADVVNPKDLRQGVPLDQAQVHLATPSLTIRYIRRRFSIEGLYIVQPVFNILPLPGSDFSTPLTQLTGFPTVVINRELYKAPLTGGGEYGARVSQTLGGADISAFILNGYDRNPYYAVAVNTVPGSVLSLNEQHWRMVTEGFSLAKDIRGYLLRAEAVYNAGKVVPTLDNGALSQIQTSEIAYAASIDLPSWGRLNSTLQYSSSNLGQTAKYLSRPQTENFLSLRLNASMFESSSLEGSFAYALADQGIRSQLEFMTPISSKTEARFGIENYGGSGDSEYGRLPRASRVYVLLRVQVSS